MGRKRKVINPDSVSSAKLPPCRVCGAPGAGFHYGANTCEACKGFFHRSLKIWTKYTCKNNEDCVIEHGHRKLCQKCRYEKCLSMGMAKEAIKTGRYTCMKRTKDILEVKSLKEGATSPASNHIQTLQIQSGNFGNMDGENFANSNSQTGKCSSLCGNKFVGCVFHFSPEFQDPLILSENCDRLTTSNIRQNAGQNDFVQAATGSRIGVMQAETESQICLRATGPTLGKFSDDVIESFLLDSNQDLHPLETQHCQQQQLLLSSSLLTPSSITSPVYGSPLGGSTTESSPLMLQDSSSLTTSILSPCTSSPLPLDIHHTSTSSHSTTSSRSITLPQVSVLSSAISSLSTSSQTYMTSSLTHQIDVDTPESNSKSNGYGYKYDADQSFVSELYNDKDVIVRALVQADEDFLVPVYGQMTDEEIQQQQSEHVEACRLRREIFGPLRKLPDNEYDYIFVTTGLDTDDRQKGLHLLGDCLEKMIRAMVKFCKAIPGFSKLNIADKVQLIKYSRQEFYIFLIYKSIDYEKRIVRGFDNQWKCDAELSMISADSGYEGIVETLHLYMKFCHSLQNLRLSHEELVVIRALIVMSPDRDRPVMSPVAREIRWHLTLCLIHVLSKKYPSPFSVYAKIMDRLTEARSQTEGVISFFRKLKLDKYSNVLQNPLLKEMCGGIFFDCDSDDDALYADT